MAFFSPFLFLEKEEGRVLVSDNITCNLPIFFTEQRLVQVEKTEGGHFLFKAAYSSDMKLDGFLFGT